jgi:hypothetical protein
MDDQPPEPTLTLSFVKGDLKKEFNHLWLQCVRTASYGIEHFMDHGRALADMRSFLKKFDQSHQEAGFALVCEKLETTVAEARKRISLANTWDAVRRHLDESGSHIRMPKRVSHIDTLNAIEDIAKRPVVWEQMYSQATDEQITITARWMDTWINNYKALPVPSEQIEDGIPSLGEDEIQGEGEVQVSKPTEEDVPHGTPAAQATTVPKGGGPLFKYPPEIEQIINRICTLCGGDNPEQVEEWRKILSDPLKVQFEDLIDWEYQRSDEDIRKIGRLIYGNMSQGLRSAIRVVDRRVDGRTTLSFMTELCTAEGGRWEHIEGSFRVTVTKIKHPE